MNKKVLFALSIFFIAVISRLIPHYPNFTPIEAIAMFGGTYLAIKGLSFILPILAIYATDLVLNNTLLRSYYPSEEGIIWFSDYMIYTGIAIIGIALIGRSLRNRVKPSSVLLASFAGSILFFLVSNFGVWLTSIMYPRTWMGLIECYTLALPFLRNSIVSALIFSGIMYGSYEWLLYTYTKTASAA